MQPDDGMRPGTMRDFVLGLRGKQTMAGSPSANDIQRQLEQILTNPGFATSERHRTLLYHLVSMALAGKGAEVKEYVLGSEILGRGEDFDPWTDPIVRTEVSRLRAKLKTYYDEEHYSL